MTFVTISSEALQSLAMQLEDIRKMAEVRAIRLAASPHRIYQLKEAGMTEFVDSSLVEGTLKMYFRALGKCILFMVVKI